ncbi:acyltransferase family protein [Shimia sp.]|uniref:acyltransferase family protein n=1 Tax=Shimia sp. TaxID=1954381 RepID=UPI003B8ADA61
MHYRTEIDGLRAIAILGVVLFHAGLKQMSGGFAGVDVFFVISGYLIGGKILDDLAAGQFSFKTFYTRRARRILPALVVMIFAVMCLGWFSMMPNDYRYMGGAAVTALLSLSNVWFLTRIDYFNPEAKYDPLIHTWSLGIEEQFYLIIPLLLLLLWRWRPRYLMPVLALLALASFGIALVTAAEFRMEAFYLLHTRAWELLVGVLVAWSQRNRPLPTGMHSPAFSMGLLLIVWGLWSVPPTAPWPGLWTLPTVIGTVLVLWAPQAAPSLRKILSNAPMRFLGLISYSLYLWHQPVISLLKKAYLWPDTLYGVLAVLAAMIVLATLSWKFVEQLFRGTAPLPRLRLGALFLAVAGIWGVAIAGDMSKGFPARMPDQVLDVLAMEDDYSPTYRKCLPSRKDVPTYDFDSSCTFGPEPAPSVLLIGDSHGARLAEPLADALSEAGLSMRQLTLSSCLPVADLINVGQSRAAQCPAFNKAVLATLQTETRIKNVVMFASWTNYMFDESGPNMFGRESEDGFYSVSTLTPPPVSQQERESAFAHALAVQLDALAQIDRHVTLVLPTPRPDVDIPRHYATQLWWGTPLPQRDGYPRAIYDELGTRLQSIVDDAVQISTLNAAQLSIVKPAEFFCTTDQCDLVREGKLLFTDGNHASLAGIDLIVPPIVESIRRSR